MFALSAPLHAVEYFVAPDGDDGRPGTKDKPFATIQRAASQVKPGDTVYLRAGAYREDVVIFGLRGREGAPVTFRNYEGEKAVLDGTVPIEARWERSGNGVWRTTLDRDVWQLFSGGEMLTLARWPNAKMTDPGFWNQKATFRKFADGSAFGRVVDTRPSSDLERKDFLEDEGASLGQKVPDGINTQSLGETGVDMTGAIAVMNMGSWMTWAQYIEKHEAGSNAFTYSKDFSGHGRSKQMTRAVERWCGDEKWWVGKNMNAGQGHYFLEGLPCLDRPGEWWFDHKTRTLSLIPPEGATPDQMRLRGKVATYALDLKDCSHVVFNGVDFFGATFRMSNCGNVVLENAELLYPNINRRVLDELGEIPCSVMESPADRAEPNRNMIRNCRFAYTDGAGLQVNDDREDVIDNCLFHDIDYSCIGDGKTVNLRGDDTTIRRCTVYNAGGSECVAAVEGAHIQLCHFYNIGKLQHDGSATQFGSFQRRVEVDHCWSHNHPKNGFRFDGGGGPPRPPSQLGTMHHNVTWQTGGFSVKGDRHLINNNVVWRTFKHMIIMDWAPMNGVNKETVTINNLAAAMDTRWWGKNRPPVPGVLKANLLRDPTDVLRDPENWDFRPRPDADEIIDAGTVEEGKKYRHFDGIEQIGKAPDIGAYEHGARRYWIPGYQHPHASTPVPPDGSTAVKRDADLMFLEGYKATEHVVYFGDSPETLERKAVFSDTNIFTPPALESGKTYYWRVDARRDGQTIDGEVWRFQTR